MEIFIFFHFESCCLLIYEVTKVVHSFSPVWERLCFLRLVDLEKALAHQVQTNGFPPVWETLCLFRLPDLEKTLSHWVHENFFSPVWERLCLFWSPDGEKALSHWLEAHSLSPVWESLCLFRLRETLVALGAGKFLLSCMGELVCLHGT